MSSIGGIEIYPILSFLIFFIFFVVICIWTIKANKEFLNRMSNIPFNDNQDEASNFKL